MMASAYRRGMSFISSLQGFLRTSAWRSGYSSTLHASNNCSLRDWRARKTNEQMKRFFLFFFPIVAYTTVAYAYVSEKTKRVTVGSSFTISPWSERGSDYNGYSCISTYITGNVSAFTINETSRTSTSYVNYNGIQHGYYATYSIEAIKTGTYTLYAGSTCIKSTAGGYQNGNPVVKYNIIVSDPVPVSTISLNTMNAEITIGEDFQLQKTIIPSNATNKTVIWTTSNEGVAIVNNNGLVTGVGIGTANIICIAHNGVSAKCEVTVKSNVIQATGISLNYSSSELQKDGKVKLVATVTPNNATNKSVSWKSSDETVAVVAPDGTVTGLKSGVCNITAITADGSNHSASCVIIVYDVTSINIPDKLSLNIGETHTFKPVIIDNKATTTLTWKSTNTSVAEINSSGLLTAKAAGTTTITCTANNGVSAKCEVTVKSNVILATGISLNKKTVELEQGETIQLTATVSPSNAANKSVTWSNRNPDIACVDGNGLVTAVNSGICSIVATTLDGSNLSATCHVHVLAEEEPEVKQGMIVWRDGLFDVYDINVVDSVSFDNFEATDTRDYVDLGLPSGTLWATCNLGASKPEEYGDYFAWGETTGYNSGKTFFNWSTYEYCQGSVTTMTKYCTKSDYGYNGFTDNLTELLPADDAATANWGVSWCMPSHEQQVELINNCTSQWTQRNGVNGLLVTGPNGGQIFLPAAGYRHATSLNNVGSVGVYWSSSLDSGTNYNAYNENFKNNWNGSASFGRGDGFSIRPVRVKKKIVKHEYVDLGLPSGTLWATCNVGANSPEEYGDYFSWGETKGYNSGKTDFNWSTYKYCQGSGTTMTKYCTKSDYGYNGFTDNLTKLLPADDAATANWGASWCMPSQEQQVELINNCTSQWTQLNGVNGLLVTGPNRNQIFLPAAGYRHATSLNNAGSVGVYWSSSLDSGTNYNAYNENFKNNWNGSASFGSGDGFSVRPVLMQ